MFRSTLLFFRFLSLVSGRVNCFDALQVILIVTLEECYTKQTML